VVSLGVFFYVARRPLGGVVDELVGTAKLIPFEEILLLFLRGF
jgi:hypothetical protein